MELLYITSPTSGKKFVHALKTLRRKMAPWLWYEPDCRESPRQRRHGTTCLKFIRAARIIVNFGL